MCGFCLLVFGFSQLWFFEAQREGGEELLKSEVERQKVKICHSYCPQYLEEEEEEEEEGEKEEGLG